MKCLEGRWCSRLVCLYPSALAETQVGSVGQFVNFGGAKCLLKGHNLCFVGWEEGIYTEHP